MSAKDPKGRKAGEGREKACGLNSDALQQAIDREDKLAAEAVASHVSQCDPCSTTLSVLQSQRDALQFLLADTSRPTDSAAIQRILRRSAKAGRDKLADLLYELSKACLVMLPNLRRRVERRVEPRGPTTVANELQRVAARLGTTATGVTMVYQPTATPTEDGAISTARACLQILENVEGPSERQCLAMSQVLIFEDKPNESELLLKALLRSSKSLAHSDLAEWNLMLSLMRQRRYPEAIDFGRRVIVDRPNDAVILYNLSACHASLRQPTEFDSVSKRLAQLMASTEKGPPEWLINLIRYEAPNFAECLGISAAEVERRFGLATTRTEGPQ